MTIQEDRIYDDGREPTTAYLASEIGVVAVELAGTRIGRFRADRRCDARDVAADGVVAVATDEDVLVSDPRDAGGSDGPATGEASDDDPYRATGFGPAVAVGIDGDALVAASPDREIYRRIDDEWFQLAAIDRAVRAVDGTLVAAADGIYRATPDGLDHVGLDDGHDVAACGPYAATGSGLYELGNGWLSVVEGAFDVVDCSPDRDRSHAAAGADLYARRDGEWIPTDAPADAAIAGVAYARDEDRCTYAVTVDGTMLARDPDEDAWRTRNVGVRDVTAMGIP